MLTIGPRCCLYANQGPPAQLAAVKRYFFQRFFFGGLFPLIYSDSGLTGKGERDVGRHAAKGSRPDSDSANMGRTLLLGELEDPPRNTTNLTGIVQLCVIIPLDTKAVVDCD